MGARQLSEKLLCMQSGGPRPDLDPDPGPDPDPDPGPGLARLVTTFARAHPNLSVPSTFHAGADDDGDDTMQQAPPCLLTLPMTSTWLPKSTL